jgi:ATP-dependent Zn protease
MLREADQRAYDLLVEHRGDLDKLVDALVQNEEMDRDEVETLLGIDKPLRDSGKVDALVNGPIGNTA